MRDIDRVLEILDEQIIQCDIQYRHGEGLTHTGTRRMRDALEQAREILQGWPAKVYAVGVEPQEGRDG